MKLLGIGLILAFATRVASSKQHKKTEKDTVCTVWDVTYILNDSTVQSEKCCKFNDSPSCYEIDSQLLSNSAAPHITLKSNLIKKRIFTLDVQLDAVISVENIPEKISAEFSVSKPLGIFDPNASILGEIGRSLSVINSLDRSSSSTSSSFQNRNRRLSRSRSLAQGVREVLLVRVVDKLGDTVLKSDSDIADDWFNNDQSVNGRYEQCSGQKLSFIPATGTGITNGFMTVTIDKNVEGEFARIVETWVTDVIGIPSYDHVVYLLPAKVNFGSISAYAVGNYLTVFSEAGKDDLSTAVHVIGHNLNLGDSGMTDFSTYLTNTGDQTCMMGYVSNVGVNDFPTMCFNAPKSYVLGWYDDRHVHVDVLNSVYHGKLVGIDDYVKGNIPSTSTEFDVIVKYGSDLLIMYNRRKGINSEVQGQPDMVTVTLVNPNFARGQSYQIGAIDEGNEFRLPIDGTPFSIVGKVCDKVFDGLDYATVLIFLEGYTYPNGVINPECETNSPTASPSSPPIPGVKGDPHFQTWAGENYDFHGVCDLVLLRSASFGNNAGLEIQVRTKRARIWSFVSAVAVQIGNDTLEVMGGLENEYWINGEKGVELSDSSVLAKSISGHAIQFTQSSRKSREFVVVLHGGTKVLIKTWNSYVSVSIEGAHIEDFGDSMGLMGTFPDGTKLGRDNITAIDDMNTFGQEWQVLESEPKLFHETRAPQAPEKCHVPSTAQIRRRLGQSIISKENAELACSHLRDENFDLCVFDIMATNDIDAAGAY